MIPEFADSAGKRHGMLGSWHFKTSEDALARCASQFRWTAAWNRLARCLTAIGVVGLLAAGTSSASAAPALRVCADPDNMPFSNEKEEGFENKLAELIASGLGRELDYAWFSVSSGYVPNTMGAGACDLVMGYAQGTGLIEDTNPYYYTAYVLISRAGDKDLADLETLSDPRLGSKQIGIFAGTPPASILALSGLIENTKSFDVRSGESQTKAAKAMIDEIASGELDAGILWGPVGGYYASRADVPLRSVPLANEPFGPATVYGITLGLRPDEPAFKHEINRVLAENQSEIDLILQSYNVPVLTAAGEVKPVAEAGQ